MTANRQAKNLMLDVAGEFARITSLDSRQSVFRAQRKISFPFSKFARIRVIRVFTVAFLRKAFGKRDRRATGPTSDRA
jgi:hypothetical protein